MPPCRTARIEFRIGVNLGDVIVEGEDIYGDGVNVAARLEGIAEPGGIAVSQLRPRSGWQSTGIDFRGSGEQQLKNIERPIRVYNVSIEQVVVRTIKAVLQNRKIDPRSQSCHSTT